MPASTQGANERTPYIDPAIPAWLAKFFPDKCPDESDTGRAIWMAVGAARVVKKLRATVETQQNNVVKDLLR